ncbi:MAG: class I SAM-dependent methyltransferase [Oscillospiraceae bacterium]|nr:class I SAM-dependent methyltransferase [Oscillospiraceae bacterium]
MYTAHAWQDYELIDTGDGEKLERWGSVTLRRPDPQVIWKKSAPDEWRKADASYTRSETGGGAWEFVRKVPESWTMRYGELSFTVRPTGFKHTGLFPEQAANWDWVVSLIRNAGRPIRVLNLFAYTGGATLAAASAGARVTHVDAAKGMVQWAKENYKLSGLAEDSARWIIDDALAFVLREARRGNKYDAVIMDPPSYGRGPDGSMWKLERDLFGFCEACRNVLSDTPLFLLISSYTTGLQPIAIANVMSRAFRIPFGSIHANELALPVTSGGLLPAGSACRWENEKLMV